MESVGSELSVGWVDPRVGLGWVGNGSNICVLVGWVRSEMADVRKIHY